MIPLPPAVFSTRWRDTDLSVFTADENAALSLMDAASVLSAAETTRAERFHFARDRERWMRSRALLRLSLARRLDVAPESLVFETAASGKPALALYPECHFNLSHSADRVAIAIGPEPVGVDIENLRDDLPAAALASHAFPPEEAATIAAAPDPRLLFYQLWTAKEAVMKCTGLGMSLPPADITVAMENDAPHSAASIDGRRFPLFSLRLPDGYSLAAAQMLNTRSERAGTH